MAITIKNGRSRLAVLGLVAALLVGTSMVAFADQAATETLFKAKCAMCHGADASGNTAMGKKFNIPNLRAPEVQKQTPAQLAEVITKGKNKMPPFDGKLTSAEITQLADYLHHLK